jgi:hypothetical protein
MTTQWKQLLIKITVWAALEVAFNLIGLDSIADYSEYLFSFSYTKVMVIYEHELI